MKLFWNCSLSLINFLISFPIVLRRIIDLNTLEKLYSSLLGLRMMMDVEILKCEGQWSNSKYTLAILIMFLKHILSLTIHLRCLHDNSSGPEDNELLHFEIELMNSSSEKRTYPIRYLFGISSNTLMSIWWFWAMLNDK